MEPAPSAAVGIRPLRNERELNPDGTPVANDQAAGGQSTISRTDLLEYLQNALT